MVSQFNETYKADSINELPALPDPQALRLAVSVISEEFMELHTAYEAGDIVEYFDALCDLLYVVAQQANLWGFPISAGLREVHRSNMSKLDTEGRPIIREDGKVLKGPDYSPPDLRKVLDDFIKTKTQEG